MSDGYAKIFASIYDGTLAEHWQALVTFQQLMILSNARGVVDMTPFSISRRTGIPLEIIEAGIAVLAAPDPRSRSKEADGRRIVLLDPGRDWGWRLVNHAYYRGLMSATDKKEADRIRIAEKRDKARQTATDRDMSHESPEVADVAQAEAEALKEGSEGSRAPAPEPAPAREATPITPAVAVCKALRAEGIAKVNAGSPHLIAALNAGHSVEAVVGYVLAAKEGGKGDPFAYGVAAAANESPSPPARASPASPSPPSKPSQSSLEKRNHDVAQQWAAKEPAAHAAG